MPRTRVAASSNRRGAATPQLSSFEAASYRVQAWAVIVAFLGGTVWFSRTAWDGFELPKMVLIGVCVLSVVVIGMVRAFVRGTTSLPAGPMAWSLLSFALGLVVATSSADNVAIALTGEYKRYTGLLPYLGYAALTVVAARTFNVRLAKAMAGGAILVGLVAGGYAIVQWVGADPLRWGGEYAAGVFTTLGNPNFAAAGLGILVPFAGWGAIGKRRSRPARLASGAVLALLLLAVYATGSAQGIFTVGAGLGVLALAWILTGSERVRTLGSRVWVAAAGLGVAAGVVGLLGIGPLAFIGSQESFTIRKLYWRTAVDMFVDRPVTGFGLGAFGSWYPAYRPAETVGIIDPSFIVDQPHNVVLAMLANGGILLGLGYLAFVAVTAWALVSGLRRLEGEAVLLLGALGGGWAAYQIQSLVSIDVPMLAVAHWVLAGAIIALARPPRWVVVPLPWSSLLEIDASGRGAAKRQARRRDAVGRGATAAVVILVLLGTWVLLVPYRADAKMGDAVMMRLREQYPGSAQASAEALDLVPWWPQYWFERAKVFVDSEQYEQAAETLEEMVARDPRSVHGLLSLARAYGRSGEIERSNATFRRLMEVDPHTPVYRAEFAEQLLHSEDPEQTLEAVGLLEKAVSLEGQDARMWLLLGRAHMQLGNDAEARAALQQMIEVATDEQQDLVDEAERRLEELS